MCVSAIAISSPMCAHLIPVLWLRSVQVASNARQSRSVSVRDDRHSNRVSQIQSDGTY